MGKFYYSNKYANKENQITSQWKIHFRLKNFSSKIFCGIKKVAGQVAPTLHEVMGQLIDLVSMLHPGAGQIKGTIRSIASGIDKQLIKK